MPGETTSTTTTTAPSQSAFSTSLNTAVTTAPELTKSPGLSVGIASAGGNVQQNAQATARGTNAISDANAQATVAGVVGGNELEHALNWFGNHVVAQAGADLSPVVKGAEAVGSKVLSTLNKPMQIVQHEYRYLHDVEATHGMVAATLEGLAVAAGAAAGVATTGSLYGATLGAEAASTLESQVFYRDSWDRTGQASYADPHTHQQVSLGRDIVSELSRVLPGLQRGSTGFRITSGLIDGVFDMNVGGTELLGLAGKANSAAGLGGTLGDYFPGKAPQTTEAFDNLLGSFSGGNVRRAFADIASKNAGEIAMTSAYKPIAQQHDLLVALGNAQSAQEVTNIFRSVIRTHEMVFMDKLPTLSATRLPFQIAHEAMGDATLPGVQRLFHATSRLPETYDDAARLWTAKEFDPTGVDDGTLFVARTALFTEDRTTAAAIATEYANADLAGKVRIWRNLVWSTLATMSGHQGATVDEYLRTAFDDPEARALWGDAINRFISTSMFGKDAVYGLGLGGADISTVRDMENGTTMAAGITANQTGKLAGLDLAQVRRAAGQLAGRKNYLGRLDDFAFDNLTQPVFKRWVLMSPSYAMHIALAELIPNSLRLGVFKLARAAVEERAANIGVKVEEGEANAVAGLVWKLFQGARDVLPAGTNATIERRLGYMSDYITENGGDMVAPELASGHNVADEILPREERTVNLLRRSFYDSPQKTGDDFGVFGLGHEQYDTAWQARLHEVANDGASQLAARRLLEESARGRARDALVQIGPNVDRSVQRVIDDVAQYLRDLPERDRGSMLRSRPNITSFPEGVTRPPDLDQYDEWARAVVENVRGLSVGANGTIHTALLEHVANGETVTDAELKAIPKPDKPVNVSGRELLPSGDPKLQRIANWGFRRVLNPMVNFLSRQPISAAEYASQRELLQGSVDAGIMTQDEARVLANTRTVQNVIKNVHNLTDRTQWTVTFRNWAPFYFAQEQAYRRMGRLLAQDPAAFRKYQLMISSMHNVGQIFAGKDGRGYFVLPGTGFMTAGAVSALAAMGVPVDGSTPVGMGWNLSSSSVIFPLSAGFRPDIGPLLSIPVSAIAQYFPETLSPVLHADLTSISSTLLGPTATEPIYEQMVPNTIVQRLLTAAVPGFNSRAFNSTMMQVLATLDYENKIPPPGSNYRVMQAFMDRVRMQTRILYVAKALYGGVTPVSPELTDPAFNQFTAELSLAINQHKSVAAGIQAFLAVHPDATPFTVWQSMNPTGGTIPSSVAAQHWIDQNYDLITRYPNAGILLMPMTGMSTKYNASVYNEQIAQGLRVKYTAGGETPTSGGMALNGYIEQLYISAGNAVFYQWLAQYEQQIKTLSGSAKYNADQAFWGNGSLGSGTVGRYALQNPVWGNWFNSNTRESERGQAIIQMEKLLKENPNIKSTIADNTRVLLEGYKTYESQISTLTKDGASSSLQTDATNAWKQYLYGVAASSPEMTNVITGLFLSIPTSPTAPVNISSSAQPGVFNAASWRKP